MRCQAMFKICERLKTEGMSMHNFPPFYVNYFVARGFRVLQSIVQPRNEEFLAYAVFRLTPV